ncbi:mechanosensitive ion channel family protein [Sphingorhabdus lutea]|nr:mechanosensitive ion channel domain-containing protein [Sphingorhabdus lutea]
MNLSQIIENIQGRIPDTVNEVELFSSFALIIMAAFISWIIAKFLAPKLSAKFGEHEGTIFELLKFLPKIIFELLFGVIMLSALALWSWQIYAEFCIGFAAALAMAAALNHLLRAANIGYFASVGFSIIAFFFIFTQSIGGLTSLNIILSSIGFSIGEYRFTLWTAISGIFAIILLLAMVRLSSRVIKAILLRNPNLDDAQKALGEKLSLVTLVIISFFIGIDILGIDLTALAVFSGAFGLAIGFGLQKTFGNLIAGIILLMDRSIKPGDVIAVGDSFGEVKKIGIRAVSVITRDSKEHLIPNENLMTNEVENWSYTSRKVRIKIPVGVSYNSEMELVEKLMIQAASETPRVLKRPAPAIWWSNYGASSVDFEIMVWISDPEEGVGNIRSAVLRRLWFLFKENDIEIPFPQHDLNIRTIDDELVSKLTILSKDAQTAKKISKKPSKSQ